MWFTAIIPESKVYGANMGPTWVVSVLDGPHVGPMNLAIRVLTREQTFPVNQCKWCINHVIELALPVDQLTSHFRWQIDLAIQIIYDAAAWLDYLGLFLGLYSLTDQKTC